MIAFAFAASAQTADEIIARMDKEVEKGETKGLAMTMSMKIPVVGEFSSRIKSLGDNSYAESMVKGEKIQIWSDKKTNWTYNSKGNEVVIENSKAGDNNEQDMVKGLTEGYKATLKKETVDTWVIKCDKLKSNEDKDDPNTMDLVVSKETYLPVRLSTKIKMVKVSMTNFTIGVSPEEVKYDPSAFKDAKITDKR